MLAKTLTASMSAFMPMPGNSIVAFMRAELWKPETWNPGALPSMACIVKAVQRTEETLEDLERYYGEQYANYLYRKAPDSAASTPPPSAVIGT